MFVRLSNDTTIQWLEVNNKHIIEDENGNYEVTVKATQDIANVKITLSNILATVTMGGEVKQAKLEENIILPESGDTVKTITVTAVDGTVRTCTLTIHKQVNNLGLEKVYLDGRIANKVDDNTFEIDVKKGTTNATIQAVASSLRMKKSRLARRSMLRFRPETLEIFLQHIMRSRWAFRSQS